MLSMTSLNSLAGHRIDSCRNWLCIGCSGTIRSHSQQCEVREDSHEAIDRRKLGSGGYRRELVGRIRTLPISLASWPPNTHLWCDVLSTIVCSGYDSSTSQSAMAWKETMNVKTSLSRRRVVAATHRRCHSGCYPPLDRRSRREATKKTKAKNSANINYLRHCWRTRLWFVSPQKWGMN